MQGEKNITGEKSKESGDLSGKSFYSGYGGQWKPHLENGISEKPEGRLENMEISRKSML